MRVNSAIMVPKIFSFEKSEQKGARFFGPEFLAWKRRFHIFLPPPHRNYCGGVMGILLSDSADFFLFLYFRSIKKRNCWQRRRKKVCIDTYAKWRQVFILLFLFFFNIYKISFHSQRIVGFFSKVWEKGDDMFSLL